MTLSDIQRMDKPLLSVREVADVLGVDPQGIRTAAHQQPDRLGFPTIICGRRGRTIKVPRIPFLQFMGVRT